MFTMHGFPIKFYNRYHVKSTNMSEQIRLVLR